MLAYIPYWGCERMRTRSGVNDKLTTIPATRPERIEKTERSNNPIFHFVYWRRGILFA
jgi:hypothetical protein